MDNKDQKASHDDPSTSGALNEVDQPVEHVDPPAESPASRDEASDVADVAGDFEVETPSLPSDLSGDAVAPSTEKVSASDSSDPLGDGGDSEQDAGPSIAADASAPEAAEDRAVAADDDDWDDSGDDSWIDEESRPAPVIVLVPRTTTKPLPWLSWHYSAILPVALLALLATFMFAPTGEEPESIAFRVIEDGTGAPLAGVEISVGEKVMTSDAEGIVHIDKSDGVMTFRVEGDGFPAVTGNLDPNGSTRQQVSIPRLANTSAGQQGQVPSSATTGETTSTRNQVEQQLAATPPADASAASTPTTGTVRGAGTGAIEGTVLSAAGNPLQGARITDGKTLVITGKDGLFSMDRGKLAADASLTISASGYADHTITAADVTAPLDITLDVRPINAIYMNPNISTTEADVDRLIEIIDTTDANAIVIDIKEELIFYDSQVEFFRDAGTVRPIIDFPALLKKFEDRNIYTIARLVVFKDSLVAEKNPDLAVLNNQTGDLWRDMNGVSWVNPMVHDLWEANSDLAVEAATLGFDEIQYDYVRFPTDGDLTTMDFGIENTQENRENAINKFLKLSREKLLPTGAKLSADVFGYTLLVDDDLGIGQNFVLMAEYVDYLSPMVYPSHFPEGSIDVDGHPNDFPYETIEVSMRAGRTKLDGNAMQIRPWLQDFSFFDLMPYGDDEVRAQIDAAEDVGTSGWMLWDPNNEYHPGALDPEEAPASPAAVLPGSGRHATVASRRSTRRAVS
jgi:hypothetical protein